MSDRTTKLRGAFVLACLLLVVDCRASDSKCVEANYCQADIPAEIRDNPKALHELIVDARTRKFPASCFSCEEGTACFSCERIVDSAMQALAAIPTDDAAREAAAIVIDERLHWDGGPALMMGYQVAKMGPRVVPYLQPDASESALAASILKCIEEKHPCI